MPYSDPAKQNRFYILRKKKLKVKLIKLMGGACEKCGFNGHPDAFDFHHADESTKKFEVASKISIYSWERILAEARKCLLLCANCHRVEHSSNSELTISNFDEKQDSL